MDNSQLMSNARSTQREVELALKNLSRIYIVDTWITSWHSKAIDLERF